MSAAQQQRTVIGPLTTTWTPPASCTTPIFQDVSYYNVYQAQSCSSGAPGDASSCWPPASTGVIQPTQPFNGWGFYSPGLICPHGYTTACSSTTNGPAISAWQMEYPLIAGETAVGCCPVGYNCYNNGNAQTCLSIAGGQATFSAASCSGTDIVPSSLKVPLTVTVTDQSTYAGVLSAYSVYAPMFEIRWQSKDLAALSTSTSASTTMSSASSATSTSSPHHSSGLSIGATVAIGVIVPVVVISALVLGLLFWRRRRRTRNSRVAPPEVPDYTDSSQPLKHGMEEQPAEYHQTDHQSKNGPMMMYEMQDRVHEMDSSLGGGRYELGSHNAAAASELEGSNTMR